MPAARPIAGTKPQLNDLVIRGSLVSVVEDSKKKHIAIKPVHKGVVTIACKTYNPCNSKQLQGFIWLYPEFATHDH